MSAPTDAELRAEVDALMERYDEYETAVRQAIALDQTDLRPSDRRKLDGRITSDLNRVEAALDTELQRLTTAVERRDRMNAARVLVPLQGLTHDNEGPTNMNAPTRITREPLTYPEGGQHSFLADLYRSRTKGAQDSTDRLNRHRTEMAVELRNGPQTTSSTEGGEFVPPFYIGELFGSPDRGGRPFADAVRRLPLPSYGMQLDIPRVTTGHLTGSQTAELQPLAHRDAVTDDIHAGVVTIGGYGDASKQSLDRSTPGLDEILFADLVQDYHMQLDTQLLLGTGEDGQHQGILEDSNRETVTYTASPGTAEGFYKKVGDASARIATALKREADTIVMHPRRWFWLLSESDENHRPLIAPVAPTNNQGSFSTNAEGFAGSFMGLAAILDANLPTTLGTGTNEDTAIVTRRGENILWEDAMPSVEVSEHIGFNSLTVTFRLFAYSAFSSSRKPKANASISGTGLAAPTWAVA